MAGGKAMRDQVWQMEALVNTTQANPDVRKLLKEGVNPLKDKAGKNFCAPSLKNAAHNYEFLKPISESLVSSGIVVVPPLRTFKIFVASITKHSGVDLKDPNAKLFIHDTAWTIKRFFNFFARKHKRSESPRDERVRNLVLDRKASWETLVEECQNPLASKASNN
jgi:hypothetical protein